MIAIDYALAALWLALSLRNKAALLPLLVLLIDCWIYAPLPDIARHSIIASLCFILSIIRCTPDYLRNPLLAAGSLYWVGSADELLYTYLDVSTVYYDVMPYLVIMLNAYIAMVLFQGGGLNFARIAGRLSRLVNSRRIGL